jgi:hypothetical protein
MHRTQQDHQRESMISSLVQLVSGLATGAANALIVPVRAA